MALTTTIAASAMETSTMILATSGAAGATNFLESDIGGWIKIILGVIGALVVIGGIFRAAGAGFKGKIGEVFKTLILTGVVAALMFNPQILLDFVSFLGSLVNSLLDSVEGLN